MKKFILFITLISTVYSPMQGIFFVPGFIKQSFNESIFWKIVATLGVGLWFVKETKPWVQKKWRNKSQAHRVKLNNQNNESAQESINELYANQIQMSNNLKEITHTIEDIQKLNQGASQTIVEMRETNDKHQKITLETFNEIIVNIKKLQDESCSKNSVGLIFRDFKEKIKKTLDAQNEKINNNFSRSNVMLKSSNEALMKEFTDLKKTVDGYELVMKEYIHFDMVINGYTKDAETIIKNSEQIKKNLKELKDKYSKIKQEFKQLFSEYMLQIQTEKKANNPIQQLLSFDSDLKHSGELTSSREVVAQETEDTSSSSSSEDNSPRSSDSSPRDFWVTDSPIHTPPDHPIIYTLKKNARQKHNSF